MRVVIQRVLNASVTVDEAVVGAIDLGLLVYLGVGRQDSEADARFIADKLAGLRIFADAQGKMNRSVQDVGGSVLLVSQFTLYGDCRKGRRPGFELSAPPAEAERLYLMVGDLLRAHQIDVPTGSFGAHMLVESVNDGPVTFLLDSQRVF